MVQAVNQNPEEGVKTGTRYHPNNQVKADHPKKPSPFGAILKEYRYEGGEITKWFVDTWDHFKTMADAISFMAEQMDEKKYRAFSFQADWPAIIDKFIWLKTKLQNQEELTADQKAQIYVSIN